MAYDDIRTDIEALLDQLAGQPEDVHELHELIRERLGQLKAMGMPLPDDLVELEALLMSAERGTGPA